MGRERGNVLLGTSKLTVLIFLIEQVKLCSTNISIPLSEKHNMVHLSRFML